MTDRYEDRRHMSDDEVAEAAHQAPAKDGDPLAELARLIGQTDPFANFGRANPTHPLRNGVRSQHDQDEDNSDEYFDREIFDEAPSQPAWIQHRNEAIAAAETAHDDISSRPHPLHRFAPPEGDDPAADPDTHYADGRYPDAHYGDQPPLQQSHFPDDPYDDYSDRQGAGNERRRRGLLTAAAVLGLAVIGTGGAFAYRTYVSAPRSGSVPVIKADNSPIKVVPPTSADAANKLIQDRLGSAAPETIIPREEQPVDVRDPTKAGARAPNPTVASRAPSATSASGGTSGTLGGDEPRRVRTFTVKGDQADIAANPAPKPAARTPAPAAPARPATTPGPTASLNPAAPLSLRPQATAPATSGGYVVQVSSQRSESDAQASFRALQTKFPAVLGSRSPLIKRADLGEKGTYYRAVLGPFTSPEEAARLCGDLKSAGGQCVVQRN